MGVDRYRWVIGVDRYRGGILDGIVTRLTRGKLGVVMDIINPGKVYIDPKNEDRLYRSIGMRKRWVLIRTKPGEKKAGRI